ncbi:MULTISPECIES: hypothetical protein [Rhizobium/Agrobacterium group]|uniref:Uncharacterized protein n=2 Tax=Neorhizobium TaxID=1525371 RepID=A0ABV0M5W7_9HYPH|nr:MULTISPECIES: hypothetical protein [Rhizobium/Agrobacterium group]MCC2610982.1 hypothetical protein [Neorhizobium petrolearium]WGI66202.1 hypothetical protein QEO92_14115 [Neorhizobium petrolearium]
MTREILSLDKKCHEKKFRTMKFDGIQPDGMKFNSAESDFSPPLRSIGWPTSSILHHPLPVAADRWRHAGLNQREAAQKLKTACVFP